jgi:diguanylate cyclase (GGDEF)-like protein
VGNIFKHIGDIAESIPIVTPHTNCETVYKLFKASPHLEGLAIVGENTAPSLMMRAQFFQQIGTQYGYTLYMPRPISLMMNVRPLVVDYAEQITDVSIQAMNRDEDELYDLVLVMAKGSLVGAVSIRRLLLAVADVRAEMAIFMNPLTGLPGNHIIEDRLSQCLNLDGFSLLYIDLDHFKTYNDSYGFKQGDELLQATASLLRSYFVMPEAFLGHIGGDDFITIVYHHQFRQVCQELLADFERIKHVFYNEQDWVNGYVIGEGRSGTSRQIPLVSLSIAVVTNRFQQFVSIDEVVHEATRVKKLCKSINGSIVTSNEDQIRTHI